MPSRSTTCCSRPTSRTRRALFGNIQQTIDAGIGHVDDATRRKILWGNAARLYRIEEPSDAWRREAERSITDHELATG